MDFGSFDASGEQQPLAEINMVPLIDVMLVLLIMFIIAAPLLTHAVKIDLPRAQSTPNQTPPENVQLAIDAEGRLYWNGEEITPETLSALLQEAAQRAPQPELHLRAERTTPYETIAEVMSDAARCGLTRIGFITDPGISGRRATEAVR